MPLNILYFSIFSFKFITGITRKYKTSFKEPSAISDTFFVKTIEML